MISDAEVLSLCKQASKHIMKQNNNLDLNDYDQFLGEFQKFSSTMFDFGDNSVFKQAEKSNEEKLADKLKRSTNSEYEKTEKKLKVKFAMNDISPERVQQAMKKYPPF